MVIPHVPNTFLINPHLPTKDLMVIFHVPTSLIKFYFWFGRLSTESEVPADLVPRGGLVLLADRQQRGAEREALRAPRALPEGPVAKRWQRRGAARDFLGFLLFEETGF